MSKLLSALRPGDRMLELVISKKICVFLLLTVLLFNVFFSVGYLGCTSAVASSDQDTSQLALTFLGGVADINLTTHPCVSLNASRSKMPHSQHVRTDVKITVGNDTCPLETVITFVDNKFWIYRFSPVTQQLEAEKTYNECLAIAGSAIRRYENSFNASYCGGLMNMLSEAIASQNRTVESDDALLKISPNENRSTSLDMERFIVLQWYKKIENQFVSPFQSVWMSISRNGLLTGLMDDMATHYIGTTNVNVTEEQALNISRPFAETYGEDHGQGIVLTKATLEWERDSESLRGDDFALYPVWAFEATYDKTTQSVFGYGVLVWADNGEIIRHGPRIAFGMPDGTGSTGNGYLLTFLFALAFVLGLTCIGTYLRRRNRKRGVRR